MIFWSSLRSRLEHIARDHWNCRGWNLMSARTTCTVACSSDFRIWLIFACRPEAVLIVAISHARRRPLYWLERLT